MNPVTDTRAETKLYSLLLKTERVTLTNEIETLENYQTCYTQLITCFIGLFVY